MRWREAGIETLFASLPQFLAVCAVLAIAEAVYVLLGFAPDAAAGNGAALVPQEQDAQTHGGDHREGCVAPQQVADPGHAAVV